MSKKDISWEMQAVHAAMKVAVQYVQDLGYEQCSVHASGWKSETDKKTVHVAITARRGPKATRRTPEEELHVHVRLKGYGKTITSYYPSLATQEHRT